jgi:hypothetical protein
MASWEWALEHVTTFTLEAGMIPAMIDEINFLPGEKDLFIRKAGLTYSALMRISRKKAESKRNVNRKH